MAPQMNCDVQVYKAPFEVRALATQTGAPRGRRPGFHCTYSEVLHVPQSRYFGEPAAGRTDTPGEPPCSSGEEQTALPK